MTIKLLSFFYLMILSSIVGNMALLEMNNHTNIVVSTLLMVPFHFAVNVNYFLFERMFPENSIDTKKGISIIWTSICMILSTTQMDFLYTALQTDGSLVKYGIMTGIGFFSSLIIVLLLLLTLGMVMCVDGIHSEMKSFLVEK